MKYIVLTFDDGLLDFKNNAIPILNKYKFKCTLAVVSGFSDKTVVTNREYIDNKDIFNFFKDGHDIALHSNRHLKEATPQDFEICKKKISKLLGISDFGLAVPYSNQLSDVFLDYFDKNDYLYVFDYKKKNKMNFKEKILFAINKFLKNEKIAFRISSRHYRYRTKSLLPKSNRIFRMPATRKNNFEKIKYVVSKMKNNDCYTIMFHSIINNVNDDCEWPGGAWTCFEFDLFLKYLSSKKDICVLTQKELVRFGK